jgi:hypothetical protein
VAYVPVDKWQALKIATVTLWYRTATISDSKVSAQSHSHHSETHLTN